MMIKFEANYAAWKEFYNSVQRCGSGSELCCRNPEYPRQKLDVKERKKILTDFLNIFILSFCICTTSKNKTKLF